MAVVLVIYVSLGSAGRTKNIPSQGGSYGGCVPGHILRGDGRVSPVHFPAGGSGGTVGRGEPSHPVIKRRH